jgi:regulator of sigma E protease
METFFIRAIQLILSLSILVVLHEFGHFAFARLFKVRVDKFYMFFNPKFSLIRAKKINGKWQIKFFATNVLPNERNKVNSNGELILDEKGKSVVEQIPPSEIPEGDWRKYPDDTEWGIGWLPLGGYCKISGMVDESMDKAQMAEEPKSWEFRSRSVWQRMGIITGGVLVNFILALVIYSAVLFTWGEEYLPMQNAKYGLEFSKTMQSAGFKNGDIILKIDGQLVEKQSEIFEKILIDGKQSATVLRDSQQIEIKIPTDFAQKILAADELSIFNVRQPFIVAEVSAGSGAEKAQLQAGDSIIGINAKPMHIFQDIVAELSTQKNIEIKLSYVRKGITMQTKVKLDADGKMGIIPVHYLDLLPTKQISYGFFAAIPAGITMGWGTLTSYVKQMKLVFTKEGSKKMGGFGAIGKMFPKTWDWQIFWTMTALLSVILAFMNFLPIPALDGGYVLYLIYEMISGKKPNDKFMEYAQTAGFFLLMGLLVFANGNDLFKAIFK